MNHAIRQLVKRALKRFDIGITGYAYLQHLIEKDRGSDDIELLLTLPPEYTATLVKLIKKSMSQRRQDLFVLSELGFKRDGFFVEFGAADGIHFSNTYLLEKEFNWKGILAEPARCWLHSLRDNRTSYIDTSCVWSKSSSTITFNEVSIAELSTIDTYNSSDRFHEERKEGKTYEVQTLSLLDLLAKYSAPESIDYISIDTEGSEYDILRAFNFKQYDVRVITCEHNFTPARQKINALLTAQGYVRKFQELSQFDDWYVKV